MACTIDCRRITGPKQRSQLANCYRFLSDVYGECGNPTISQEKSSKQFHSNHTWTNRMKSIARAYAYSPGIDKVIEILTKYFLERENKLKVYSFPFLMMWLTFIIVTRFLKCSVWRGGNHFVYIVSAYSYFIGVFMAKGTRIILLG